MWSFSDSQVSVRLSSDEKHQRLRWSWIVSSFWESGMLYIMLMILFGEPSLSKALRVSVGELCFVCHG